jgi:hypothetical protein
VHEDAGLPAHERRGLDENGSPKQITISFVMSSFQLWAQPWWVNLLILIQLAAIFSFKGRTAPY